MRRLFTTGASCWFPRNLVRCGGRVHWAAARMCWLTGITATAGQRATIASCTRSCVMIAERCCSIFLEYCLPKQSAGWWDITSAKCPRLCSPPSSAPRLFFRPSLITQHSLYRGICIFKDYHLFINSDFHRSYYTTRELFAR